jgi:hypothetical protein
MNNNNNIDKKDNKSFDYFIENTDCPISSTNNDDNGNEKSAVVNEEDIEDDQLSYSGTKIIDATKDNDDPITSQEIKFVLDTIAKQALYDKTQIKQIFVGICSSQTSTKIHHNINSKKSGEGKFYLLKLVSNKFPESFTIKFNDITDKALYHQNGFEAIKNIEIGRYEELDPILNEIELEIEELKEKIKEENVQVNQTSPNKTSSIQFNNHSNNSITFSKNKQYLSQRNK